MFYFIPAWHSGEWRDSSTLFYWNAQKMEFDDTINQIRMFNEENEDLNVITLSYLPNLRYLLHRQNIFSVPSTNLFDILQGIEGKTDMQPLNFRDLDWGDDAEFIYTAFEVVVYKKNHMFAEVSFGIEGNVIHITIHRENGTLAKKLIFDDRGFLSSVQYMDENGNFSSQEYLNADGIWRFRLNADNSVTVNERFATEFSQVFYDNIEDLLQDKLQQILSSTTSDDAVVIATDLTNSRILKDMNYPAKTVYSYFESRGLLEDELVLSNAKQADLIIVDSNKTHELLLQKGIKNINRVTPFDTRLHLARSQRVRELKIAWLIDGLNNEELKITLEYILSYMLTNKFVELTLMSFDSNLDITNIQAQIMQVVQRNEWDKSFELTQADNMVSENQLLEDEDENAEPKRQIRVVKLFSEIDLIKELDDTRLVLDFSEYPNTYLQIASISAGIPQINRRETIYIGNYKNGIVIKDVANLPESLNYYLSGLRHWNEALMYAVNKINQYSSSKIVTRWHELLDEVKDND